MKDWMRTSFVLSLFPLVCNFRCLFNFAKSWRGRELELVARWIFCCCCCCWRFPSRIFLFFLSPFQCLDVRICASSSWYSLIVTHQFKVMNRAKSPYLSLEKVATTRYMHLLRVWQSSDCLWQQNGTFCCTLTTHKFISIFLCVRFTLDSVSFLLLLLLLLYFNGNVVSHEFACAVIMADVVIFLFPLFLLLLLYS